MSTPYREAAPGQGLPCPRCPGALAPGAIGETSLYACPRCGGTWLDAPAFNALLIEADRQQAVLAGAPNVSDLPDKVAYLKCPRCDGMMVRSNLGRVSGIVVDSCRKHGVWLDRGELWLVADFMTRWVRP